MTTCCTLEDHRTRVRSSSTRSTSSRRTDATRVVVKANLTNTPHTNRHVQSTLQRDFPEAQHSSRREDKSRGYGRRLANQTTPYCCICSLMHLLSVRAALAKRVRRSRCTGERSSQSCYRRKSSKSSNLAGQHRELPICTQGISIFRPAPLFASPFSRTI